MTYGLNNPRAYGAVGDGITDDSAAFVDCISANIGKGVVVDKGNYKIGSNVVFPDNLYLEIQFGAVLVIPTSVEVAVLCNITAGLYQIFKSTGKVSYLKSAPVEWFGADHYQDCSPAIQNMVSSGVGLIKYGPGVYNHNSTIVIPGGATSAFVGEGFRLTSLRIGGASKAMFKFERTLNSGGCVVSFKHLEFIWIGSPIQAGSCAILFRGYADRYDDNWLRVESCCFYYFETAVWTKWCGQSYFVDNFYQANKISHRMDRGSSFFYFRGCMSFDERFIFANDPVGDAYSNGMVVENCNAFGSVGEAMYVNGWQSVYVAKSGFDMGQTGDAAVWVKNCQDVSFESCFISSDPLVALTRKGIIVDKSRTVSIKACSIVNNYVGVDVYAPDHNLASQVVVDGCKFGGVALNYIILRDWVEGCKLTNNHFETSCNRQGSNFEIYGPGSDRNICAGNTFHGQAYTISLGLNSIVKDNIFGVKS